MVGILWAISRLELTSLWWRYFVLEMNYNRNVRKVPLRTFVLPVNICWYIIMFYFIFFNLTYPFFMLRFWSGISCTNVCIVCMFTVRKSSLFVCLLVCYSVCVGSDFVSWCPFILWNKCKLFALMVLSKAVNLDDLLLILIIVIFIHRMTCSKSDTVYYTSDWFLILIKHSHCYLMYHHYS